VARDATHTRTDAATGSGTETDAYARFSTGVRRARQPARGVLSQGVQTGSRRCSATGHDRASPAPSGQSEGAEPLLHPGAKLSSAGEIDGSVDRLVRNLAHGIGGMCSAKPRGDLLGRPALLQSAPHIGKQRRVRREPGRFGVTPRSHEARYASRPPLRPSNATIARIDKPAAIPWENSPARSSSDDGRFCAAVPGAHHHLARGGG